MNQCHCPEADHLNKTIQDGHPSLYQMLSDKGKSIYFPRCGILQQGNEAKGKKINATIGMAFEDDGTPIHLPSIARYISLNPTEVYPYTSSFGLPALRDKWQAFIRQKNQDFSEPITLPVVTNGLTHGLSTAAYLFVDPGDQIIIPDIMWENYGLIYELGYGAECVTYPLFTGAGVYNIKGLESSLASPGEKKILVLNFPNNPTGYTCTDYEAAEIISLLVNTAEAGKKVITILDDAYFGLVYEPGITKCSLFAKLAGAHPNILAVKVDGATKEDYAWGFRVGFLTYGSRNMDDNAREALIDKTGGAIRGNISSGSHLSQSLLLKAMNSDTYDAEKTSKYELLHSRYETVKKLMAENSARYARYFEALPFNSGYFMCIRPHQIDSESLRKHLLSKYDCGVIACKNLIRIAYSSVPKSLLPELFENIYRSCEDLERT